VRDFFDEPRNRDVIEKLRGSGVRWPEGRPTRSSGEGPLTGETIVITGTLASMTRDEARDAARSAGATVTDSVSKKTTLLVVGAEAGSKLRKAQELGVRVVEEADFLQLLGRQGPE
jgi:DNA ligase (NAD+)